MEWTEKERDKLDRVVASVSDGGDVVLAVASKAVELAAARLGPMDVDGIRADLDTLQSATSSTDSCRAARSRVDNYFAYLGARIATLEVERDTWKQCADERQRAAEQQMRDKHTIAAERDTLSRRLEETNQRAQENWEKQRAHIDGLEKSLENARTARVEAERQRDSIRQDRDTAVSLSSLFRMERDSALKRAEVADAESATHLAWMKEERARAEHAEARVRDLAIAGQELSAAVDKHVGEPPRYPCSPTCTHDDAAFPGHSGRIVERSEAFTVAAAPNAAEPKTISLLDGGHRKADQYGRCRHHEMWTRCGYCDEHGAGLYAGVEAMRAALLTDVLALLQREGFADGMLASQIKAAIEEATP